MPPNVQEVAGSMRTVHPSQTFLVTFLIDDTDQKGRIFRVITDAGEEIANKCFEEFTSQISARTAQGKSQSDSAGTRTDMSTLDFSKFTMPSGVQMTAPPVYMTEGPVSLAFWTSEANLKHYVGRPSATAYTPQGQQSRHCSWP